MAEPVVHLKEITSEIVQITMEDKNYKNAFSADLVQGLQQCFDKVNKSETYKIVILTGYDSYFCSGAPKEVLFKIQEGKMEFTAGNIFNLILKCKIPVIAAMQGHGIGAGFSFGLFADFIIMSSESFYAANYMNYGFTPGFGATYILPKKLGETVAEEMLYTAENYSGEELKKRGVQLTIIPRAEVLERAYQLAQKIANKPQLSLITLKSHRVEPLIKKLMVIIDKELEMHKITLCHQDEVIKRINSQYRKK